MTCDTVPIWGILLSWLKHVSVSYSIPVTCLWWQEQENKQHPMEFHTVTAVCNKVRKLVA